jgi:hypothetical protein
MKIKDHIRKIFAYNYFTAKAYYHLFSLPKLRQADPLLIFQMGKVGSSTISKSLKEHNSDRVMYHAHDLTDNIIDLMESSYRQNWSQSLNPAHLWQSQYIRKVIKKYPNRWNWDIITLVRDPVARNISGFFQTLFLAYDQDKRKGDELSDLFLSEFDHETPLVWFDREMKGVFGIDVFGSSFSSSTGYKIYEGEGCRLLLIRLEDLDSCAPKAIEDFLGIENFKIMKSNVGTQKAYSQQYHEFLKHIKLPAAYIDRMYNSKYAQHFYSEHEIENMIKKWQRAQ